MRTRQVNWFVLAAALASSACHRQSRAEAYAQESKRISEYVVALDKDAKDLETLKAANDNIVEGMKKVIPVCKDAYQQISNLGTFAADPKTAQGMTESDFKHLLDLKTIAEDASGDVVHCADDDIDSMALLDQRDKCLVPCTQVFGKIAAPLNIVISDAATSGVAIPSVRTSNR